MPKQKVNLVPQALFVVTVGGRAYGPFTEIETAKEWRKNHRQEFEHFSIWSFQDTNTVGTETRADECGTQVETCCQ